MSLSAVRTASVLIVAALLFAVACSSADEVEDWARPDPFEGESSSEELTFDDEQPAYFQVIDDRAYMAGVIGSSTPDAVDELLEDHPNVSTIVLVSVPGSEDDEANLEAALLVHDAGLATHVPSDGEIASGGVDFFLAGRDRSFDDGAAFGVHSWGTGEPGFDATSLDEDDPEHNRYLDYYDELGVDEDFYWFTIEAAPPEDIHWMTADELVEFGFATG